MPFSDLVRDLRGLQFLNCVFMQLRMVINPLGWFSHIKPQED